MAVKNDTVIENLLQKKALGEEEISTCKRRKDKNAIFSRFEDQKVYVQKVYAYFNTQNKQSFVDMTRYENETDMQPVEQR